MHRRRLPRSALWLLAAIPLLVAGCDGGGDATAPDPAPAGQAAPGDPSAKPTDPPPPPAAGFDFSGAWTMENTVTFYPKEPAKVGTTSTFTCTLVQRGTGLSGSCMIGFGFASISGTANDRSFEFSYQFMPALRFTATGEASGESLVAGTLRGVSSGVRAYESRFTGTR